MYIIKRNKYFPKRKKHATIDTSPAGSPWGPIRGHYPLRGIVAWSKSLLLSSSRIVACVHLNTNAARK